MVKTLDSENRDSQTNNTGPKEKLKIEHKNIQKIVLKCSSSEQQCLKLNIMQASSDNIF